MGTGGDDPAKADTEIHDVKDKDIVILASDGLWDNLFDVKVIELIRPFIRDSDDLADPELVAEVIASQAEQFSMQRGYLSPFAKGARENYYDDYMGGKPDDITVIVAQIMLQKNDSQKLWAEVYITQFN